MVKVPFFFNIILEHIHAFVQPWQEFKNSTALEICLLHSKPFINNHFHFHFIVECATSEVLLQQPEQHSEWSRSSYIKNCNNSFMPNLHCVMLEKYISWQVTRLGLWSKTWEVVSSTLRWTQKKQPNCYGNRIFPMPWGIKCINMHRN